MKKKTIFNIFTTLALSANLFTTTAGIVHADANTENVNTQNVKQEKMTLGYPFAKLNKKGVHPMYNAQVFGKTNYARSLKPLSYFHDGWGFGWGEVGQTVKTGQKIGKLTGSHLHLSLTKTNHKYINANGFPCNNWFINNGTWLNPVKVIQKNLKK